MSARTLVIGYDWVGEQDSGLGTEGGIFGKRN